MTALPTGHKECDVAACTRRARTKTGAFCEMHYYRQRRGNPVGPAQPLIGSQATGPDYLWNRIEVTGFCWNWVGHIMAEGYGRSAWRGRVTVAHRAVYEELVGAVPRGLHLDHLCRNRACVNPDHLEPVTPRENVKRGLTGVLGEHMHVTDTEWFKTQCVHGHARRQKGACRECHLIETHARRGKPCTVANPCHQSTEPKENR